MINQYHMALINDNDFGLEGKDLKKKVVHSELSILLRK